jgi:pimeloyl-ACP methyl ester carboxylesterase
LPVLDKETAFQQLERLRIDDMRGNLSQIQVPVLLIHGDKDQICLPEASKYMHEKIPGSDLQIFQGAGHVPFLEDADEFNLRVRNFINKHENR